jgi:LuxR family maltose regulon positive regulatory protein
VPSVLGLMATVVDVTAAADVAVGVAGLYGGDWAAARSHLETVPEGAHLVWHVAGRGALALLEAWSGRLEAAELAARHAMAQARELGIDQQPVTTARLALAHVALRRGQLGRAASLLDEAGNGVEPDRRRVIATIVASEQASLALASGAGTGGLTLLAARHGYEHPPMPPYVLAHLRAIEAELLVANGDLDRATQILGLADGVVTSELAAARVHLAVERHDLRQARAVLGRWPLGQSPRAGLEFGLWRAVVDHLGGDEPGARDRLEVVAAAAAEEGDLGLFRWAGEAVAAPARAAYRATPTPFLRTVVEGFTGGAGGRPRSTKDLVEQLTDREHAVLALLPTRLSNTEIAERLDVSLNTVKTHIKHVYRKLGVTRRGDAVSEAERLRLL